MNPYDRRAVREVWARVSPGRDVFAPGPAPVQERKPPAGQGGKPPASRPVPLPEPAPEPAPPAQLAADQLASLAAGYDLLARRLRMPRLRQLAAQCRRGAATLQRCANARAQGVPDTRVTPASQRQAEAELRQHLERLDGPCRMDAERLRCESQSRTRLLQRLR